jgi:hypothetical protein
MSTMSYISAIERYHEYRNALRELLASIVTGIADERIWNDRQAQQQCLRSLAEHYPFVDLLFLLDPNGIQCSENITLHRGESNGHDGIGADRSNRPYYLLARDVDYVVVTDPYFSSISGILCVSAALKLRAGDGSLLGYLTLDINLTRAIEFFMGDSQRRRFQPLFKLVYSVIVLGLGAVMVSLLYLAFSELAEMILDAAKNNEHRYKPFGVVIYLTLALAIFDLAKTTLEEEVLMHKDIFRHSSTRRTITRFMAAILIAVSIESLLLMFKSALGDGAYLLQAVWMMLAAVGLLAGLGVYVYLGARAEAVLLATQRGG